MCFSTHPPFLYKCDGLLVIILMFNWYNPPLFPPVNIHTNFAVGQTMPTEQKMLSSGSVFIRRKQKERIGYEEQQSDQCPSYPARPRTASKCLSSKRGSVNLRGSCKVSLPSREAGDLGGETGKNLCPMRNMKFERNSRISVRHAQSVEYIAVITV